MEGKQEKLLPKDWQLEQINIFTQKGLALKTEAETLKVEKPEDLALANQTFKRAQALRKEIEMERRAIIFPFKDFIDQINSLAKESGQPGEQAEVIISEKILAYNEKVEAERRAAAEKERQRLEEIRLKEEAEKKAREAEEARLRKIEEDRLEAIRQQQLEAQKKIDAEKDANKKAQAEIEKKKLEEEAKLEAERVRIAQVKRDMDEQQKEIDRQKRDMDERAAKEASERANEELEGANSVKGLRTRVTFEIINENLVPRELCSPDSKKINKFIKDGGRIAEGLKIYEKKQIQ